MSYDPPASEPERLRLYITGIKLEPPITDPNCKISANIFVDEEPVYSFPWLDNTRPSKWSRLLLCEPSPTSSILLRLNRTLKDKQRPFTFTSFQVSEVDEAANELILAHPEILWTATIKYLTPTMAEQLFKDGLSKLGKIEGTYDSLKPDETIKYLYKSALQFASVAAEALLESTAKLSFLIIMKAWELLEQKLQLDDHIQDILRGLIYIRDIVEVLSQASSSMLATALEGSKGPISHILLVLEDVSVYIFNQLVSKDSGSINGDEIAASSTYDVEAYLAKLEDLQKSFYASWIPSAAPYVDSISVVEDEPSDLEQEDPQDAVDEPSPKPNPYEILNLLRPMDPNGYDPDQACMDGTREAILNRVITWTQNRENSETFMWISGQAGMGKTSIAASLCRRLDRMKALAGSFFCEHNIPESCDPLRLINNLVHTIALRLPAYAHEVAKAIRADRSLCNSHLSLRYEGLLKKPLRRLKSLSTPAILVVIVDGLDECGDYDSRETIFQKLYRMSKHAPWLKVIFTARPGGDLVEHFQTYCSYELIIHLQTYDATSDISAYIRNQLGKLARKDRWPEGSIDRLCAMSEGVFLWAALVTKYIKISSIPSLSRLEKVLGNQKSLVTNHLDTLYTRALKVAMIDNEDETIETYTQCINAILATAESEPLTILDLKCLLLAAGQINEGLLERIVGNLGPLVLVTEGRYVRFHHSSFRDYWTGTSRSRDFPIQLKQSGFHLLDCCLEIMQKELCFNICRLETSYLLNSEVPDLERRTRSHIGPALKYACIHWIGHCAGTLNQTRVEEIKKFMDGPQFMYWIEVLSLLGRLDTAVSGLLMLSSLDPTQLAGLSVIVPWAKDAHRFLLSFYDGIAASTPHLYISALALSPFKSPTAQRMRPYFPNTILVTPSLGNNLSWHPCVRSILHPYAIQALSVSPDGRKVVTGYSDGSLCIWDIQTGARVCEPLVGHSTSVTCVTFSPNGELIVSGSYDTSIRAWDLSKRAIINYTLTGHSGSVHAVAFSPVSTIVASGSADKAIRLWDTKTMQPVDQPYTGHSSRISCLAFSPDGSKLASGSWDKTIRLWSIGADGQHLKGAPLIITGHSDSVTCVAVSPDGLKIASGSVDKTIRLWDAQKSYRNESCNSFANHSDSITSIAFSPEGELIASASSDGVIKLWAATTLTVFPQTFKHCHPVNGVAFSPDGTYIISGSTDLTIRVWDVSACTQKLPDLPPLVGHSAAVYSISVSSDGTRIISGSRDQTVRMWNLQTGEVIGEPYIGHSNYVYCVAFSPDGNRFASGSYDKTLKFWDPVTRTLLNSYQHDAVLRCIAFSPTGAFLAFVSDNCNVCLWEITGWKMIGNPLQGHSNSIHSVAFSPDSAYLASGSADSSIMIWDIKTHSRTDKLLSGHKGCVRSIDFSPCGSQLVSGSDDKTIRIWDLKSGNTILELTGHAGCVMAVRFSPDRSYVASGSNDNTVQLWHSKTGQKIGQPFTGHSNSVRSIAFSPNNNHLIACSLDNTVRVWNLNRPYSTTELALPGTLNGSLSGYELLTHPDRSGWVTLNNKSLAFWLPAHYQQSDPSVIAHAETPSLQASLDCSKFAHGTEWTGVAGDRTE